MKLEVPNPCQFTSFRHWLSALVEQNTEKHAWFSLRWLAGKSKWPASLLSEVIAGKRGVTLRRALELAHFLKLPIFQTERLVLLSLATHDDEGIGAHFQGEVMRRHTEKQTVVRQPDNPVGTFLGYAIQAFLGKHPQGCSLDEIRSALFTCSDYPVATFRAQLDSLQAEDLVGCRNGRFHLKSRESARQRVATPHAAAPDKERIAREVCNSILEFHRSENPPELKKAFIVKILSLSQVEVQDVIERLGDLSELADGLRKEPVDNVLYQLCLFAFPISR